MTTTKTKTDLFHSISVMDTNVKICDENTIIDEFDYSLDQKLWTPSILIDLLKMSGLYINKIIPSRFFEILFSYLLHSTENSF